MTLKSDWYEVDSRFIPSHAEAQAAQALHALSGATRSGAQTRRVVPVSDQGDEQRSRGGLFELQRPGQFPPFIQTLDRQHADPDPAPVQRRVSAPQRCTHSL